MKKRSLAILICLIMVLTLGTVPAMAGESTGVWVGGTEVEPDVYYVNDGAGGITTDGASEKNYNVYYEFDYHDFDKKYYYNLTLKDADITKNHTWGDSNKYAAAVYFAGSLNIELKGNSTLRAADSVDANAGSYGIYTGTGLTIWGQGSLSATGGTASESYGMYCQNTTTGNITISTGTVKAVGDTAALNMLDISDDYSEHTAVASENKNGSPLREYDSANLSQYNYFRIAPCVWVGETQLADGGYYINDDKGGITAQGANADNYNVAYLDGVLTLKDANITENHTWKEDWGFNYVAVYSAGLLKINLIGNNMLRAADGVDANTDSNGIFISADLTISGEGSLHASGGVLSANGCRSVGVLCRGDLKISGGNVTATGGTANEDNSRSYGVCSLSDIEITGGSITASGGTAYSSSGIYCDGDLIISGGNVTATGDVASKSYGINCSSERSSATISGGIVEAKGNTSAFNKVDISSYPAKRFITASTDIGGSPSVEYEAGNLSTYRYFRITPFAFVLTDNATGAQALATDYTYTSESGVLTIIKPGDYTLSMDKSMETTAHRVAVDVPGGDESTAECKLTLDNVHISGEYDGGNADSSVGILTFGEDVILTLKGENTLTNSGAAAYGISLGGGCSLEITGDGSLTIAGEGMSVGIASTSGAISFSGGVTDITVNESGMGAVYSGYSEEIQGDDSGTPPILPLPLITVGENMQATAGGSVVWSNWISSGEGSNVTWQAYNTISESGMVVFAEDKLNGASTHVRIEPMSSPVGNGGSRGFTISGKAATGGSISPSGAFKVSSSGQREVIITPDNGYIIWDVLVDGVSQGPISTYTFADVQQKHSIEALFAQGAMSNFGLNGEYGGYSDVDESQWYGTEQEGVIHNVTLLGIMNGDGNSRFRPHDSIKLSEAIKMAAVVYNTYYGSLSTFEQSQGANWYDVYVSFALQHGLIKAGDFTDYDRPATRAEMAYIFAHALPASELAAISSLTAPDVATGEAYSDEIRQLYAAGVLTGNDASGTFSGGRDITRAETAAIITRIVLPDKRIKN